MEKSQLQSALANPGLVLSVVCAILRGFLFKLELMLCGPRKVSIGKGLRIYSKLYIRGPGTVIIGNYFSSARNIFKETTILTHHPDAMVRIGDGNYFGGVHISCVGKVEIGNNNLLGNTVILDSDIIPHLNMKVDPEWMEKWSKNVVIGNNTWLAVNTVVLKGVTLGDECVLSAGSVAAANAEPRSLLLGVPARKIKSTREEA